MYYLWQQSKNGGENNDTNVCAFLKFLQKNEHLRRKYENKEIKNIQKTTG
jgi:hypothetical protein